MSVFNHYYYPYQAPESMKAVMIAIRYLTNAVGNIIDVVVISALKGVFSSQVLVILF